MHLSEIRLRNADALVPRRGTLAITIAAGRVVYRLLIYLGNFAGMLTTASPPSVAQMGRQSNLIMGCKGMINCLVSSNSHSHAFSESLNQIFM
jgi:hypothetical protein